MSNRRRSVMEMGHLAQFQVKQQEESLSNEIDQNLRTLALLYPFTETAGSLFVKGAFLKANKPAFHHVVQYLIMIIGGTGLRKRFRWPILSSRDETDFRNMSLAYFNECHTNFKWDFGPFKMQVVLFPGGVEFMKIIVELTKIAMRTTLKENESFQLVNDNVFTMREAKAKLQAAEETLKEMDQFFSKIRVLAPKLVTSNDHLIQMICDVCINTSISMSLIEQGFASAWEKNQQKEIDGKMLPSLEILDNFNSKCDSFEQQLLNVKPQALCFDKVKMDSFGFLQLSDHLTPHIDYEKLFMFLEGIVPDLLHNLNVKPPWSTSQLRLESQFIGKLMQRVRSLSLRLDELQLDMVCDRTQETSQSTQTATSSMLNFWYEKLVLTPKIKYVEKESSRVPIWDTMPAIESPMRAIALNHMMHIPEDTSGFGDSFDLGEASSIRVTSTKLDAMSVFSSAIYRSKGFSKNKGSPRRTSLISSPSASSNNNVPAFSSTMIDPPLSPCQVSPRVNRKQVNFSPLRKSLF